MAARGTLAVLAVVVLAAGSAVAQECQGYDDFLCGDGKCINIWNKCSGWVNCKDGSDEGLPLCSAANTTLNEGQKLTARVEFDRRHDYLKFLLCNSTKCSILMVVGPSLEGTMHYWSAVGCNMEGGVCRSTHAENVPEGQSESESVIPTGNYTFEVEHRTSGLAVWPQGHPELTATVPADKEHTLFRVTPMGWRLEMPVQFRNRTRIES